MLATFCTCWTFEPNASDASYDGRSTRDTLPQNGIRLYCTLTWTCLEYANDGTGAIAAGGGVDFVSVPHLRVQHPYIALLVNSEAVDCDALYGSVFEDVCAVNTAEAGHRVGQVLAPSAGAADARVCLLATVLAASGVGCAGHESGVGEEVTDGDSGGTYRCSVL